MGHGPQKMGSWEFLRRSKSSFFLSVLEMLETANLHKGYVDKVVQTG